MIFFLSISANIHLQIRREECSVFYSTFALVLVPGLVNLLRTHAQLMLSSILLSFPLLSPLSHLATASALPISCVLCVRVCATNTHNNTTVFSFFETLFFFYKTTVSFTMVIKRSPGGEFAGGGRSTSKSTCVVPA